MKQTDSLKAKVIQLVQILIPILITQLAMYSMNFLDTAMSGNYSANDLAGVAIGSSLWVPVFTGLSGILMAVTPIVAHLAGSEKNAEAGKSVIQAVYLSVLMAVLVFIAGSLVLEPVLGRMSLQNEVHEIAKQYLLALSTGIIPLFVYNVLRCFIDALGQTKVSMLITLSSLPLNAALNYLLIFGKFGFPELGGAGAGYASAATYCLLMVIALVVLALNQPFASYPLFSQRYRPEWGAWKEILVLGVPIGFAIFFETSIFSAVTLFMAQFNTVTIASHQAAMNFASLLYMVPLSISMALTVIVGFEVGARRYHDARQYSWIGMTLAVLMSVICGLFLLVFREEIASIYSKEPEVIALTANFLVFALFFQLSDALQAPIQGALRGYKDVNITFVMALISYWIIGLPLGYLLANYTGMMAYGYWAGLIAGLAIGACCLLARLAIVQKKYRVIQKM